MAAWAQQSMHTFDPGSGALVWSVHKAVCCAAAYSGPESSVHAGQPVCNVVVCHADPDCAWLAAKLHQELIVHGLKTFMSVRTGLSEADFPKQAREAAWTCRVFIVLVTPLFFTRQWPVLQLRAALTRAAQPTSEQQQAVTIVPLFVLWTGSQAEEVLQQAAATSASHISSGYTRATGDPREGRLMQQPASTPWQPSAQLHSSQQPAAQALALLQELQRYLQPTAQREPLQLSTHNEVQVVAELLREALHACPRRFQLPEGKCPAAGASACSFCVCCNGCLRTGAAVAECRTVSQHMQACLAALA